jgi:hypothetical protein
MNDHVVMSAIDKTIKCMHCGAKQELTLPMTLTEMVTFSQDWANPHIGCGGDGQGKVVIDVHATLERAIDFIPMKLTIDWDKIDARRESDEQ